MKKINVNPEIIIAAAAFIFSGIVVWHVSAIGMLTALVDQNSHLNLSRQFFDSMTPGISQIGFWPPLLHILMAPVVMFDPFYQSGLAGYVVLAPAFAAASIFLYRICLKLTGNAFMSLFGAFLFILNPFILYYTATPMMEVLYLAFLFASTYYFLKWFENQKLSTLIFTGVLVSLTTLSRFEGLFLIPVSIIIVAVHQLRKHKSYYEIEALGIIFGIVGIIGLMFIFGYGYIYGGNILSFANSQWSAFSQQRDYLLPTEHNPVNSFIYLIHASYHVLGKPVVIISFICLGIVIFTRVWRLVQLIMKPQTGVRRHTIGTFEIGSALAIMGTPFLFDIVALIRGNAIIYVPELLPYGVFFNERYGLYWIGFVITAIVLALSILQSAAKKIRYGYSINLFLINAFVSFLLIWNVGWMVQEVYSNNYRLVKDSAQGYPSHDQAEVADYLRNHYDWGKVFMTRALHDFIAVEAHVPLRNYVHESNYKYFDQVLERPWLFARWVVMYNPGSEITGNWAEFNEKISGRYGNSSEFNKYYQLIVENERERLYRIRPEAVAEYAFEHDYSVKAIPSLNSELETWNPDTIYLTMKSSKFSLNEAGKTALTARVLASSKFKPYYEKELKPMFRKGYFADDEGGNSTYQSYALLQAYFSGDRDTFQNVWSFTKEQIQHQSDYLFSSIFEIDSSGKEVNVIESDPVISADTDIAYVLYRAGEQWNKPEYTEEADFIVQDLWDRHVASVGGRLVVSSKTVSENSPVIDVKTSTIVPYAYHEFAKHDISHTWKKLAADSYVMLNRLSGVEVHPNTNVFLPAEGAVLQKLNNKLQLPEVNNYSADITGDTFQIYWRISFDAIGNKNKSARNYMYVTNVFDEDWKKGSSASILSLSAPLAVWTVKDAEKAEKLVSEYYLKNRDFTVSSSASFYERSWFWFALGLWSGELK